MVQRLDNDLDVASVFLGPSAATLSWSLAALEKRARSILSLATPRKVFVPLPSM
jgi:hypothetical protein